MPPSAMSLTSVLIKQFLLALMTVPRWMSRQAQCNGGKILGNAQMGGTLLLDTVGGPLASNRVDVALRLTGERTLRMTSATATTAYIYGVVDGGE